MPAPVACASFSSNSFACKELCVNLGRRRAAHGYGKRCASCCSGFFATDRHGPQKIGIDCRPETPKAAQGVARVRAAAAPLVGAPKVILDARGLPFFHRPGSLKAARPHHAAISPVCALARAIRTSYRHPCLFCVAARCFRDCSHFLLSPRARSRRRCAPTPPLARPMSHAVARSADLERLAMSEVVYESLLVDAALDVAFEVRARRARPPRRMRERVKGGGGCERVGRAVETLGRACTKRDGGARRTDAPARKDGAPTLGAILDARGTRARRARPVRRRTVARAAARWPSRRPPTTARYWRAHGVARSAAAGPRAILLSDNRRSRCPSRITPDKRAGARRGLPRSNWKYPLRRHHPADSAFAWQRRCCGRRRCQRHNACAVTDGASAKAGSPTPAGHAGGRAAAIRSRATLAMRRERRRPIAHSTEAYCA